MAACEKGNKVDGQDAADRPTQQAQRKRSLTLPNRAKGPGWKSAQNA